jgi:hypothetical protein
MPCRSAAACHLVHGLRRDNEGHRSESGARWAGARCTCACGRAEHGRGTVGPPADGHSVPRPAGERGGLAGTGWRAGSPAFGRCRRARRTMPRVGTAPEGHANHAARGPAGGRAPRDTSGRQPADRDGAPRLSCEQALRAQYVVSAGGWSGARRRAESLGPPEMWHRRSAEGRRRQAFHPAHSARQASRGSSRCVRRLCDGARDDPTGQRAGSRPALARPASPGTLVNLLVRSSGCKVPRAAPRRRAP